VTKDQPLVVTGTVAPRPPRYRSGDVLVVSELAAGQAAVSCGSAALIAGELRRAGLAVHTGSVDDLGLAASEPALIDALGQEPTDRPSAIVLTVGSADGRASADEAVSRVLSAWRAALGPRTVLLAEPRSFCAGVERAIDIVEIALARYPHPVYVRKQIVHNTHVVKDLASRGAVFVDEIDEVPENATVVFSAHGVAPAVRQDAARRGLNVIDATCPLVSKVHAEVRRYAARVDRVYLIGHAGHEESEGTLGEAPGRTVLVQTPEDVRLLADSDAPTAYVMQTTLGADEARTVVDALEQRFPGIRGPVSDDICYATTNRQNAVVAVASEAELLLVVGSANSSNSVRLVERSEAAGTPALLVEDIGEVPLAALAGVRTVGVTAGASAAPALVDEIVANLSALGPTQVKPVRVAEETIRFGLPSALAS
jgi:4-hydroxy-3-methylbut-2-enyl diphosphate reductase